MSDASELLAAGAVLPLGTEGAGEQAVPLAARTYRHPALDDRAVVRLAPVELGAGEDQAAGFLGLERLGEPEVVGLGQRAALGFPEWVLVHRPEDGHHALAIVPELERIAERVKVKPKAALDAFNELAGRLASSVPHLLPTFYERAARTFLEAGNAVYAAQMFNRARDAEAEHALPVDEERLDAVFLEFTLAGALPVKAISGYAKGLAVRVPAEEALRRFTRLCVRRTANGLPPSAQTAAELRRLAKAAGEDVQSVEHAYLTELFALPATKRAAMGWWKAHRSALASLAGRRPEVLGILLNMMPVPEDQGIPDLWLEILEAAGAFTVLCDPDGAPEEARPEDGSVGWLNRFLDLWSTKWYRPRPLALLPLVERMGDRLRAELTASGESFKTPHLLDLLDLMLALDIPVDDPGEFTRRDLDDWARTEGRRDLLALAADPRFREDFHRHADHLREDEVGRQALRTLLDTPGGRPLLADWVAEVARRTTATGLPAMPGVLKRLGWLPSEVLALAGDAARAMAAAGLTPSLRRTLRAGLFDELGWPAWEEAVAALSPPEKADKVLVADAWPHLIVADRTQARVIGAEGAVLTHDLRIPDRDLRSHPGFHYVDGELLVHWESWQAGGAFIGYWHADPDRHQPMEGDCSPARDMSWTSGIDKVGLPMRGGGRAIGAGVLRRGDTVLPERRQIITDGTSYWVWAVKEGRGLCWQEYDPVSGEPGREGMPGFFADAARDLPDGRFSTGWLLPAPGTAATPVGTPVDGLLGWRVVQLPDRSYRCEDLAGNTVTAPKGGPPFSALFLPGDDRPRAVVSRGRLELIDPDGVVTSSAAVSRAPGAFAEGTVLLPPLRYWHCLSPRDPRGSAALRGITTETVSALLKAAMDDEDLSQAVRRLLPDLTHEALIAGVAGVVRYAATQQRSLDATAERLEQALAEESARKKPDDPSDELLKKALDGLILRRHFVAGDRSPALFTRLRAMARATTDKSSDPAGRPLLDLDGTPLPESDLPLDDLLDGYAAVAYRAVSPFGDPKDREVLRALLTVLGEAGPAADGEQPARWRRAEAEAAARGPAPWFPGAAEEFSRLTGATPTTAGLLLAGLPVIDRWHPGFPQPELQAALGVKAATAEWAGDRLFKLDPRILRAVLGALLPADPARLWTDGPDVAAAAEVWNAEVGRKTAVSEAFLLEATKAVRTGWDAVHALRALLDPATDPALSQDFTWIMLRRRIAPGTGRDICFTTDTLSGAVAMASWLAHRLPAGDPLRERLPAGLAAVRDRLAHPGLMLPLRELVDLERFGRAAGAPTETGEGFERYGAVVMPGGNGAVQPGIRTALLDEAGSDPYLAVLRSHSTGLPPIERALRTAMDARFAALLADPGDPVAGERGADGTWWPQDPSRSVPGFVAEVSERYGLGADAAAVYLMLLVMPDPTDGNTARWAGWKPARLKAARAELAATDLVVEARRARAGRSLFLPGGWTDLRVPHLPLEEWKLPLYGMAGDAERPDVIVPLEPVADLYRRAWQRILDGDEPRFTDLEVRRGRRR
ncbi:DNA-binding protein [Actinocorallia aurantiaca]|uniref:DNA-binding protein n=1 Tax=Actinocorallia aurantiaca TaxID=46204 RepID=A0ABP6GK23_9ACTN